MTGITPHLNPNKHMRNKELVIRRIQTLNGLLRKLDMNIHRGGNTLAINETQRSIEELVQDITDIINREE